MTNLDAKRYIHRIRNADGIWLVSFKVETDELDETVMIVASSQETGIAHAEEEIAKRYKAGDTIIAKDGTRVQRRREADLRAGEWEGSAKYHWHADGMRVRCHWYLTTERRNEDGLMTRTRSPDSRACWVAFENL